MGTGGAGAAGRRLRHTAACLYALPAGLSTRLAVVHLMLATLFGAQLAKLRAGRANGCSVLAAAPHDFDGKSADRGAIKIQPDAPGHGFGVRFIQA